MRIARVLHESSALPIVAIERDGALYSVTELEQSYRARSSSDELAGSSDFHARVVALGCAGLAELDERLASGLRPSRARLLPGTFVWLAPCDDERATRAHVDASAGSEVEPRLWLAPARGLAGNGATLPCPPRASRRGLDVVLELAVLLGDDLRRATPEQAERAVIGYSLLVSPSPAGERRGADLALRFPAELGPVLVTKDRAPPDPTRSRVVARTGEREVISSEAAEAAPGLTPREAVAFASQHVELRGGDVIGVACLASIRMELGASVTFSVEGLGSITSKTCAGWETGRFRARD